MYWFAGNGTIQQMSIAKLPFLSEYLKTSMVTKDLPLIVCHNIKQFTDLWHLWESIYEFSESVVWKCSEEKM